MKRANQLQFRHQITEHLSHNQERKNARTLDDVSVQKIPRRRSGIEILDKAKGCLTHKTVKVNFIFRLLLKKFASLLRLYPNPEGLPGTRLAGDSFPSLYPKRKRVVTRWKSFSNLPRSQKHVQNSSPYASLSGKGFFSRSVKSQPSNKCCRKS